MLQKQKRFLWIIILATVCVLSVVLAACDLNVQPSDEQRYMQVYGMYKAYAEEAGYTPLEYLDWLQSVKGDDGVSVVSVNSKVEKDEICVYRIVFTYHYSNGTTTQNSVPYLLADGSTLTQHTYSDSWSSDDDYHWHAATCGHGGKDRAAHSWSSGVITTEPSPTTDGVRTYICYGCGKIKTESVAFPFDVPVTKTVTYVFKLADGNATIPSYVSPYLTGTTVTNPSFATGTAAVEFKPFGTTGWWYAESDIAPNPEAKGNDAWKEYQLVLGYNKSSGLGDDDCGLKWNDSLKSDECLEYAYPANPAYTYEAGQKVINLGTHTFTTIPGVPPKVSTTLVVKFNKALPEAATVIIVGGLNGWANSSFNDDGSLKNGEEAKLVMSANMNRTKYSIELLDIFTATYEFRIIVHSKGWDKTNGTLWNGVIYADADGYNARVEISTLDNNETIELFYGIAQVYAE